MSQDWSGWYKPSVQRPSVGGQSPSIEVDPPSVGRSPGGVQFDEDPRPSWEVEREERFDDILVRCYGYSRRGRQRLPINTPMYKKFARDIVVDNSNYFPYRSRFHNIRIGCPAIADRVHIGEVARFGTRTFVHNFGVRQSGTWASTLKVRDADNVGKNYSALSTPLGGR